MYPMSPIAKDGEESYPPDSSPARLDAEIDEALVPTPEKLNYVFSDEQQKVLFQTWEVRVDMTKFNCLDKFYKCLERRGSLESRSKKEVHRLLMRTFNRYKDDPRHIYSQDEIDCRRDSDWKYRKARQVEFIKDREKSIELSSLDSSSSTADTIVASCPVQSSERISVSGEPDFVTEFENALAVIGLEISDLVDERRDKLDSENTCNIESWLNSMNTVPFASQNTDYDSFTSGVPQTSTQYH